MPADPQRVQKLFLDLVELSPAERLTALDRETRGDDELRARVAALLRAHDAPESDFVEPESRFEATVLTGPADAPNEPRNSAATEPNVPPLADFPETEVRHPEGHSGIEIAGRYRLQEKIGEGGMGEVWVARQTEPVKRNVALKLIKAGMDTKAVLQRFEQERQALALMDHPNIARVLDAGMTSLGQPFFVMELVNGLPLHKFCDGAKLGIRARLELFATICQAVQHAHQKGIIHRDLKPANILVTTIDGRPVPKVIDFGVAKATAGKLTEETLSTGFGAVVGTLEYMSPEQARFTGDDVDTRADIYSLGVILYELLTGLRPIDAQRFKKGAIVEMIRIIQEEEPSRPSTRLSTDAALPSLAAVRQSDPKRLMAVLRGELDWVVMRCLEKQRDRRYETANGLAREIQRYLADEPVEARPPSAGYRVGKFLKRHKGPVVAAGLVLLALLAGIAGTTFGLIQADQQRRVAERAAAAEGQAKTEALADRAKAVQAAEAEREAKKVAEQAAAAEKAANDQAQKRLAQVEKANNILGSIFENLNPSEIARNEQPLQAILVEKLDQAVEQLEGESVGDPLVVAAMQMKFGRSLLGLGEPAKAIVLFEKARATHEAKFGPDHPSTVANMVYLAQGYLYAGKLDLALPLCEETLRLTKAKLGPEHLLTLASMENLGKAYRAAGKLDLALPLFEEVFQLLKAKFGPEHPDTRASMSNLGSAYHAARKLDLAVPLFEEALQLQKRKFHPEHPDTLVTMTKLAHAYQVANKLDLALPLYEETLQLSKVKLGLEHPQTLTTMHNLASAYQAAGKRDLALPLYEETLQLEKAKLGAEHPITLATMHNLAAVYETAGKLDLALPLYEETLQLRKAKLGAEHPDTLNTMHMLARAYQAAGTRDLARAERMTIVQDKLATYLKGDYQPATNDDRLALAELCRVKKFRRAVAGLYADAFAADPKLADDLPAGHRYNACCAAACAAAGQAEDAANLDDAEQARLRQQALAWLRADLALRSQQLESGQPVELAELLKILKDWQNDLVLAGLRDSDRVAKLPAGEREACEKLWADVAAVIGQFDETVRLLEAEIRRFAALSPAEQVEEVRQELKRRNANFDGALTPVIKNGVVTQLTFSTDRVQDIAPVRKLTQLQFLEMNGSRGPLDLSPLQGLPLTWLSVMGKVVPDLTPLRGMPLQELFCDELALTDLSPLSQLPLKTIRLRFQAERDAATLRGIKTLTTINDMPAAEFWKGIAK